MYDLTYRDHLWRWKAAFANAGVVQRSHRDYAVSILDAGINLPMGLSLDDWDELVKAEAYSRKATLMADSNDLVEAERALREGIAFAKERGLLLLEIEGNHAYSGVLRRSGRLDEARQLEDDIVRLERLCGVPFSATTLSKRRREFTLG